jgi:hypothetical protein
MRAIDRSQPSDPRGQILLPLSDHLEIFSSLQFSVEHG